MSNSRPSLLLFALASTTCIRDPGFVCTDAQQCVAANDGICADLGYCAYPDGECVSGLRFGASASDDVAGVCVGEEDDEPPTSLCGNGTVDELETCDDHNRLPGDACHPQCVEPGTVLWTVRYDGEAHREDKGYGIAIDPDSASFYVSGFTTSIVTEGQDVLLQRRWIETGELLWSRSHGGDGRGDDTGENVAIDANGDPVVAGVEVTTTGGANVWVRQYDASGQERWTATHDDAGGIERGDGVAITDDGTIVVVGNVAIDRGGGMVDIDAWIARYDLGGTPLGEPFLRGTAGLDDQALDATAYGTDVLVTGRLTDTADGEYRVWTARYDPADMLVWEDLGSAELIGNEARGVGSGCEPRGRCATAGVLSNDIWVRIFDQAGAPLETLTEQGTTEMHDEGADVAFVADGSIVVVGFIDYATEGFATGDCYVTRIAPDGTHLWTDVYDGPAHEVDKALAVELTDDFSAIVTGYETVPGQARDVWIRRYAI